MHAKVKKKALIFSTFEPVYFMAQWHTMWTIIIAYLKKMEESRY